MPDDAGHGFDGREHQGRHGQEPSADVPRDGACWCSTASTAWRACPFRRTSRRCPSWPRATSASVRGGPDAEVHEPAAAVHGGEPDQDARTEGIGRPSTYASIISVIRDRNYVELIQRRFHATDLGEVVTAKLIEAFRRSWTWVTPATWRRLDKIEEDHLTGSRCSAGSTGRSARRWRRRTRAQPRQAEVVPAPEEYRCETCGSSLVYRFRKNGRFLSSLAVPDCKRGAPDREGRPKFAGRTSPAR